MTRRVKLLLDRAEDFRRHGENGSADAALSLAAEIMTKYAISAADVDGDGFVSTDDDEIVTLRFDFSGIYVQVLTVGFDRIVQAFDFAQTFVTTGGRKRSLYVIGYASALDGLGPLLASIQLQAMDAMRRWWSTAPERGELGSMDAYKARRGFLRSFTIGVAERVAASRQVVERDLAADTTGTALVLRDRRDDVSRYVDANYDLRPVKQRLLNGVRSAQQAGLAAGRWANVGDTGVDDGDRRRLSTGDERT